MHEHLKRRLSIEQPYHRMEDFFKKNEEEKEVGEEERRGRELEKSKPHERKSEKGYVCKAYSAIIKTELSTE